jgi:hypothetical protein
LNSHRGGRAAAASQRELAHWRSNVELTTAARQRADSQAHQECDAAAADARFDQRRRATRQKHTGLSNRRVATPAGLARLRYATRVADRSR